MNTVLHLTVCSREKKHTDEQLPAIERYTDERIKKVMLGVAPHEDFRILSGKFGLLKAEDPIPYYDHLLQLNETDQLNVSVIAALKRLNPSKIIFHTYSLQSDPNLHPYHLLLEKATKECGIALEFRMLKGH